MQPRGEGGSFSPWVGGLEEEVGGGGGKGGEAFPFFVPGRYSSSPPRPLLGTKNDQQLFPSEAGSKLKANTFRVELKPEIVETSRVEVTDQKFPPS